MKFFVGPFNFNDFGHFLGNFEGFYYKTWYIIVFFKKKHCSNFEFGRWKLVPVGKIEFPATFVLWFEFQKHKEKIENEGFWKKLQFLAW